MKSLRGLHRQIVSRLKTVSDQDGSRMHNCDKYMMAWAVNLPLMIWVLAQEIQVAWLISMHAYVLSKELPLWLWHLSSDWNVHNYPLHTDHQANVCFSTSSNQIWTIFNIAVISQCVTTGRKATFHKTMKFNFSPENSLHCMLITGERGFPEQDHGLHCTHMYTAFINNDLSNDVIACWALIGRRGTYAITVI